ncbi:hypothetical protein TSO5_02945 [Azospirillum sp. TSO5]|nr:hypothetical protein TSO5_02945 [Azospirillum sp. TSO5]
MGFRRDWAPPAGERDSAADGDQALVIGPGCVMRSVTGALRAQFSGNGAAPRPTSIGSDAGETVPLQSNEFLGDRRRRDVETSSAQEA